MAAPFTMLDAMIACGVDNNTAFNGQNQAQRISADILGDDYASCIDKTKSELDDDLKAYSALTATNGQIRLSPEIRRT